MVNQKQLADEFVLGLVKKNKKAAALSVVVENDGSTTLRSYGWAVLAHRSVDGILTTFPDWRGYSQTTSGKHLVALRLALIGLSHTEGNGRPTNETWRASVEYAHALTAQSAIFVEA